MRHAQQKTAGFIALRYLFSKKKHNIINVISIVSTLGIMVCSAALIVVLSVFNGMSEMIGSWFNSFNPDFSVTLVEGKSFPVDSFPTDKIVQLAEVSEVHEVVSDMVLTNYGDRQELLRIKGIGPQYVKSNHLEPILIDGAFRLYQGEQPCVILGAGCAGKLQINLLNYELLKCYYPKRTKKNLANPAEAFNTLYLFPTGVFLTNTNYDQDLIFCPIQFARELMDYDGEATSMEIQLKKSSDYVQCQKKIEQIVGNQYKVQNKYQQEESLFKTMQSEKLMIYIILAFILLVATFNIMGALAMLILEKREDTLILRNMGAKQSMIQRIFIYEGIFTSLMGGILGIILGSIICFLQQTFHIVKLGNGSSGYVISYYPVQIRATDFLIVLATILIISLFTSILPAHKLKKANLKPSQS